MSLRGIIILTIILSISWLGAWAQCSGSLSFTYSIPSCVKDSISFSSSASSDSIYIWKWGDGSANDTIRKSAAAKNHKYSSAGSYTVYLYRYCKGNKKDSVSASVKINSKTKPVASFTFNNNKSCMGTTISFTNKSTGTSLSYAWDFGDGDTSSSKDPTHQYTSYGTGMDTFSVKLTVTDNGGCSSDDTIIKVLVKQAPDPEIDDTLNSSAGKNGPFKRCDGTSSKQNFTIGIKNNTDTAGVTGYKINWGDGSSDSSISKKNWSGTGHTYTKLGVYNLSFTVYGKNGCSATIVQKVINESNPSVGIKSPGSTIGCAPLGFYFKLNATVSPTTTFTWDFGDGSPTVSWDATKSQDSIYHVFTKSSCGNTPSGGSCSDCFLVKVVAKNACGTGTQATVDNVVIYSKAKANFSLPTGTYCAGSTTVSFTNTTIEDNCTGSTSYKWDFGDGGASTVKNPTHKYNGKGYYNVRLVATNYCGNDTIIKKIRIDTIPVANFTHSLNPSTGCGPLTVNYTNKTVADTVSYTWSVNSTSGWSFINSTNGSSINPSIKFSAAGTYYVTLKAGNNCGSTTMTDTINVKTTPAISMSSISDGCDSINISPSASFTSGGSSITAYKWTFSGGSPSSSSSSSPGTVKYNKTGRYTVVVSATNSCGTSKDSFTFNVYASPAAKVAKDDSICSGSPVSIGSSAVSGSTYSWTSNPAGFTSTTANPVVKPTTTTTYTLTETNTYGCKKSHSVKIAVKAMPTISAGNNDTMCISKAAYNLSGSPSGGWWSGNGITDSAKGTFNPKTAGGGTHTITYHYANSIGCKDSASKKIIVYALPIVSAGTNDTFCNVSTTVTLTGSPSGGSWKGKGVTSSGVFTPSSAGLGSHKLTYIYTNANGCGDSSTKSVYVISPSTAYAGSDDSVCAGVTSLTLKGYSPAGGTWSGTGVSSSGIFSPSSVGAGTYTLTYTYGKGTCSSTDTKKVKVLPLPTLSIGSNESICISKAAYNLSASPSGGYWKGTGITDTLKGTFNPAKAGTGSFSVTYTYRDTVTGCYNSASKTITVNALPTVSAGASQTFCNTSSTVTLTGSPGGGTWKGKGITSAGVFTPSKADTGWHDLTYVYADANGCSDSSIKKVRVVNPTVPKAGLNDTVCLNAGTFYLTNYSPSGGKWSGTGVDSTGHFDPALSGAGTFVLTYSFGVGTCLVSDTKKVIVKALPKVKAGSDLNFCESDKDYTMKGNSPSGGVWKGAGITDGTLGIFSPKSAGPGTYWLSYIYQDPVTKCYNTDSVKAVVNPLPAPSFLIDTLLCKGDKFSVINTSSGSASYYWNFGDGKTSTADTPSHTYTNTGVYIIKLVATSAYGCKDSIAKKVNVSEKPDALFSLKPKSGPGPLNVSFTNLSSGVILKYSWDFGNGQTSTDKDPADVSYKQSIYQDTTYHITLEVSNLCGSSFYDDSVTVFPKPTARFGIDKIEGCSPLTVTFANRSIGKPTRTYWDFGNGKTSTLLNPLPVTFTTDTTDKLYTIMLVVSNAFGADTAYHQVLVHPNTVKAFFTPDKVSGCRPLQVHFEDYAKGGNFIAWDFGDSALTNEQNPTHVFKKEGTYTVWQFVNNGCSYDTAKMQVTVYPQSFVQWTAVPACQGDTIRFTNLAKDYSGLIWHFGDGDSSTDVEPVHVYKKDSVYPVTLGIWSKTHGCYSAYTDSIRVFALPKPAFDYTPGNGCHPLSVQMQNKTSGGIYWSWSFGDGNFSTAKDPLHVYKDSGRYEIKLVAYNALGCRDSIVRYATVFPYPHAYFSWTANDSCGGPAVVKFNNLSTGANSYFWNLGNGKVSTATKPTTTYDSAGSYTIWLISTNAYGCQDSISKVFTIYPNPKAAFSFEPDKGCEPLPVRFTNLSRYGNHYTWDFGDGTMSNDENPVHIYQTAGVYSVKLMVRGGGDCINSIIKASCITVYPKPQAGFTFQVDNNPVTGWVSFADASWGAAKYDWEFDPGMHDTAKDPRYRFPVFGQKQVTHIVTSNQGCSDTVTEMVPVGYFDGLYVPNALCPECHVSGTEVFLPKGAGLRYYHLQIFSAWGELVFETDKLQDGQPAEGWDGTFHGKPCPQDVYVWKIEAEFLEPGKVWPGKDYGNVVKKTGTVSLVR